MTLTMLQQQQKKQQAQQEQTVSLQHGTYNLLTIFTIS